MISIMERKYKIGDKLRPQMGFSGFDEATVYEIDDKFYYCKIICGTASIPIKTLEETYELI